MIIKVKEIIIKETWVEAGSMEQLEGWFDGTSLEDGNKVDQIIQDLSETNTYLEFEEANDFIGTVLKL